MSNTYVFGSPRANQLRNGVVTAKDESWEDVGYRFGFGGKEKDDEVKGSGNSLDFGARIYDNRLGRWLSVDPLQAKYPGLSAYCFVANTPLMAIDPDGRYIYVVTGDHKVYRIDNPKASSIKEKIGYNTLMRTASGKAILNKYNKSKSKHIYITIGTTTLANAQAETYQPSQLNEGLLANLSGTALAGSNFDGMTVPAAGQSSFIVFSTSQANNTGAGDNSTYEDAAVLFHEIKAHVDYLKSPSMTDADYDKISHEKIYGSYNSGYNGTLLKPGENLPAEQIKNELMELKNADIKAAKSEQPTYMITVSDAHSTTCPHRD